MISNSVNITQSLKTKLSSIDDLYKQIVTQPVTPKTEIRLRQEAIINHIDGWATLANQGLTRQQIVEVLTKYQSKNATPLIAKILNYKNSLNYIRDRWSGNSSAVTFVTISELSSILDVTLIAKDSVEPILSYLYSSQLHPVIQAALAHLAFYPSRSAYLLSLLYLAKSGYDLRGWLSLEDCWSSNKDSYLKVMEQAATTDTSASWLEFFCDGMIAQMSTLKSKLKVIDTTNQSINNYISHRQKDIIKLVEQSDSPVTNREVQATFKVSQVTASRDLSKLSLLGLIGSRGAGRSTAYFRI